MSESLSFSSFENISCTLLFIKDDSIAEGMEVMHIVLLRTASLDRRIRVDSTPARVLIVDNDGSSTSAFLSLFVCVYFFHLLTDMFVGFSSQAFEITEHATVCVEVLNPPSSGAIKKFNVSILPEEGIIVCVCLCMHTYCINSSCAQLGKETSNKQCTLECNRILHFEVGQSQVCYDYNITSDERCELGASEMHFKLRLSLSSTNNLRIDPNFSSTTVTIDDSNEPECCMLYFKM